MVQVIGCKQCGKEGVDFNTWSVTVNYNLHKYCDHCNRTDTETISEFFCCKKCFEDYYINNIKLNKEEMEIKNKKNSAA